MASVLPRSVEHIPPKDFFGNFRRLAAGANVGIFKLECRQEYQEPENPSFQEFSKGDPRRALEMLHDVREAEDADFYQELARRNVPFVRVRLIEFPLTPYTQWELASYQISASYGERILLVDISKESGTSKVRRLSDFLLFDDKAVMAHDYDRDGLIRGGWIVTDPNQVSCYSAAAKSCLEMAVPLAAFNRKHGLV